MRTRTSIITGTMAALLLAVICISSASAIAPSQAAYSPTALWAPGHILNYNLEFHNQISPTVKQNGVDVPNIQYHPTAVVDAVVKYNITAVSGNAINITETISGLTINYPFTINASHQPFVAVYNQSVTKRDFLWDFAYEVHGAPNMGNIFRVGNHSSQNITLGTGITSIGPYVNNVIYYKNNHTVVPQVAGAPIINRFIVSSNITGAITNTTSVTNSEGMNSTEKIYRHALVYTPLSFANQSGTFWLDLGVADLASVTGMGLWAEYLPNTSDNSTFPMVFDESETYTWHEDQADEAFRWRAKFGINYPKVGGIEEAKFDSETGILVEYWTKQTRVDGLINGVFAENLHPQALQCYLTSVVGIAFGSNATAEVPGFPVITLLVALGIGFALVYRKFRK